MNSVHDKFVVSVQAMESRYQVFDVINEWIDHLRLAPNEMVPEDLQLSPAVLQEVQSFLEMEQDTWALILSLYFFRLSDKAEDPMSMAVDLSQIDRNDELPAVDQIIKKDRALQEMRHILDWLESNAGKLREPDLLEKFVSWEHTLETLKRDSKLGINLTKPMIGHMDPDACNREGKEVHHFDAEEEAKLLRGAFHYARSGQHGKAIEFLEESGHLARSGMLNGFKYSEKIWLNYDNEATRTRFEDELDENMEDDERTDLTVRRASGANFNSTNQGFGVLGNTERDLWKSIAWEICETNDLSKYERATLGTLCGHRKAMLDVAETWQDKLWAYLKAVVDVRVEAEIRRHSNIDLVQMPDEYLKQDLPLPDCIAQAGIGEVDFFKNTGRIYQLVQKHVITDDIDGLLSKLRNGLPSLIQQNSSNTTGHLLRFITHLLFAFGIVGLPFDQDLMNTSTEAYIEVLVREGKLACIPFYVQKLTEEKQIKVIVDQIKPNVESKRDTIHFFMQAAHVNDLDILSIAVAIVKKLQDFQDSFDAENLYWIMSCYELVQDSREVMLAFLKNTVNITRKYLILNNMAKCNQLISQVGEGCVGEVLSLSPDREETLYREFLCYKAYLEAEDSLLLYQRSLCQKPTSGNLEFEDPSLVDLGVAERTVREKKRADLKAAEEKWQKAINHHLKNCIEKYFAVITFPNGWLVDCVPAANADEYDSVKAVKRIILPKVVFVLMKLIIEQKSMETMRKFVYVICRDELEILKEFTTAEIASIFKAVEEFVRSVSTTLTQLPK